LRADRPFLGVRGAVCWDENRPRRAFGAEVGSYHSRAVNSIRVYICSLVFLYNYWGVSAVVIITGVSLFGTVGFIFSDCGISSNRVFCSHRLITVRSFSVHLAIPFGGASLPARGGASVGGLKLCRLWLKGVRSPEASRFGYPRSAPRPTAGRHTTAEGFRNDAGSAVEPRPPQDLLQSFVVTQPEAVTSPRQWGVQHKQ